ncbi:response regulator transcription factor [Aquincola sp. J276]|uniref:response regulator transcription factor n=1 Tax=Aquincola sp. J276 TaxID=2898432 RepID=UPI002151269A|nr:response regulator transcription factor [Aquincola sp. J276]MCR5868526.1 response regulator transcription factor [Aquincola sp. J276]
MSTTARRLSVGVLHESVVIQQGLAALVGHSGNLQLVATAGIGSPTVAAELLSAHVLLASHGFALELLDGPEGPRHAAVIAVAPHFGDEAARALIRRGARGLLLLSMTADELEQAVLRVGAGLRHITPSVAAVMAEHLGAPGLTCREVALLELLSCGMTNKAIARTLQISDGTVKTHARSIFSKLGANNRTQAVAVARRRGILRHGADLPAGCLEEAPAGRPAASRSAGSTTLGLQLARSMSVPA